MATNKLTNLQVKQANSRDKDYKITDGGGLYLLVKSNSTKCWRLAYRFASKQKTLAIGVYPTIGLQEARKARDDAKEKLLKNIDPSLDKKQEKLKQQLAVANTFEAISRDWWQHNLGNWAPHHSERVLGRLEADVFPAIGITPISELRPPHVKAIIRKIEQRNALDVAKRVLQDVRRIFAYAVELGHIEVNPARELTSKARQTTHRDALPPEQLPQFLNDLDGYSEQGRLLTRYATQFLLLTFVRSGELRGARWEEFSIPEKLWRIPAERMKMKSDHIVPLATQTLELLEKIRELTGKYDLLFPSERRITDTMSDNTIRRAIFRLGYDGNTPNKAKCVPHGLRTTACSILNEQGFNPDAIERQMSHMERNGVRAAYTHHAQYKDDRTLMMQWWADHLDELKQKIKNQ